MARLCLMSHRARSVGIPSRTKRASPQRYIYTRGATTAQNGACVPPFAHHTTPRVVTTATRHVRATRRTTAFATTTTRRPDARRARLPRARRRAQGGRRHVEGGALLRRGRARRVPRRRMRAKRLGAERPARAPGPARRRWRRRRWRGRRGLARGRRGRVAELPDVRADVRRRRGARGISRRLVCGCCRVIGSSHLAFQGRRARMLRRVIVVAPSRCAVAP